MKIIDWTCKKHLYYATCGCPCPRCLGITPPDHRTHCPKEEEKMPELETIVYELQQELEALKHKVDMLEKRNDEAYKNTTCG